MTCISSWKAANLSCVAYTYRMKKAFWVIVMPMWLSTLLPTLFLEQQPCVT